MIACVKSRSSSSSADDAWRGRRRRLWGRRAGRAAARGWRAGGHLADDSRPCRAAGSARRISLPAIFSNFFATSRIAWSCRRWPTARRGRRATDGWSCRTLPARPCRSWRRSRRSSSVWGSEGARYYIYKWQVLRLQIPFTLLLGVLIALTALGMDMFLPSVPVIARRVRRADPAPRSSPSPPTCSASPSASLSGGPFPTASAASRCCWRAWACSSPPASAALQRNRSRRVVLLRFAQGVGDVERPGGRALDRARPLCARAGGAAAGAHDGRVRRHSGGRAADRRPGGRAERLAGGVLGVRGDRAGAARRGRPSACAKPRPPSGRRSRPRRIAASYALLFGDARFRAALATMLLRADGHHRLRLQFGAGDGAGAASHADRVQRAVRRGDARADHRRPRRQPPGGAARHRPHGAAGRGAGARRGPAARRAGARRRCRTGARWCCR